MLPPGIETNSITSPKTISPSSAKNESRPIMLRSRRVAYPNAPNAADEQRRRTGRLPERRRVDRRVVGEDRPGADADQRAHAEEKADRELLGALDGGVHGDDADDRTDDRDHRDAAAEVAAEVGAEPCNAGGDGDEAHRLAEDRAGAVAADGDRLLGDLLEAAHVGIVLGPHRVRPDVLRELADVG